MDTATRQQLLDSFREKGRTEGSVSEKALRFLLKAMDEAKRTYSPHLGQRKRGRARGSSTKKTKAKTKNNNSPPVEDDQLLPAGMMELPVHLPGRMPGKIVVPSDLTESEVSLIQAQIEYLKLYAAQAKAASSGDTDEE